MCSGLRSCFKGQAVVLAPDSGAPLEPPPSSVMAFSYSSLEISQVRDISEFSRTGMNLKIRYKNVKKIYGYKINSYWNNIADIDAYFKTNMDF